MHLVYPPFTSHPRYILKYAKVLDPFMFKHKCVYVCEHARITLTKKLFALGRAPRTRALHMDSKRNAAFQLG